MGRITAPEPLTASHQTIGIDCGTTSLNDWLHQRALENERRGGSRTYVVCNDNQVIGYYAIATGSIARSDSCTRSSASGSRYQLAGKKNCLKYTYTPLAVKLDRVLSNTINWSNIKMANYGNFGNEEVVAKWLKHSGKDRKMELATDFTYRYNICHRMEQAITGW